MFRLVSGQSNRRFGFLASKVATVIKFQSTQIAVSVSPRRFSSFRRARSLLGNAGIISTVSMRSHFHSRRAY